MNFTLSSTTLLLALSLVFGSASCDKKTEDGEADLKLSFRMMHDQSPLQMFQFYPVGSSSDSVEYQLLEFFVSDIALVKEDGSLHPLSEVEYINYNTVLDAEAAQRGRSLSFEQVPAGEYKGLRFGIGLGAEINNTEPGDYPTTTELGNLSNYWTAWNSYIFSRIEGRFLPSGESTATFFLYHSGANGMYQELSFEQPIRIEANSEKELVVQGQAREFLFPDEAARRINIIDMPSSHSGAEGTEEYEVVHQFIKNMKSAMRLL